MNQEVGRDGATTHVRPQQAGESGSSEQPSTTGLQPFRLLYPVGSRKWNCRAAPNKRSELLGAYHDSQTILARQIIFDGAPWLAIPLPDGKTGWCKQYDEAHMVQHHHTRTGYGWYRVVYCSLTDEEVQGVALETLTTAILKELAAAPQPLVGGPRSGGNSAAGAAVATKRDRCASCFLPLRAGSMAYIASCGHSYHFECLRQLGDSNICTACGVWYAVGQSPPDSVPLPSPTSIFQHVHQQLWFVPPFYRYILIYCVMLLATPFLLLASWLQLI